MTEIKESITPSNLKQVLDDNEKPELIDVRNAEEFKRIRLSPSRLIPLPQLPLRFSEIDTSKNVYVFCKAGKRSQKAQDILNNLGVTAISLEGGIDAWHKAGYPVIKSDSKHLPSIDEQTRIAIGSLILLGLLIPKFLWWLPWFVGIMLIFAGITGNCMMMQFLAAAPWNKAGNARR